MGMNTLADTIREIIYDHIENNNGIVIGETLSSVGNTYGTIPKSDKVFELPMTDVAAGGIVTGLGLVGRRPIFVLRFQDFFLLNSSSILQDAAISKEFHGTTCPIFIRSIASDKAGPNHSNTMHSLVMQFPGIKVCAPMSSKEYKEVWESFKNDDVPYYVSEDRYSFVDTCEYENHLQENADITLYAIAGARRYVENVYNRLSSEGYRVNLVHILWLKPLNEAFLINTISKSKLGLVIDYGREVCGAAEHIAYTLMMHSEKKVHILGVKDKVKCLNEKTYNSNPSEEEIYVAAKNILKNR